MTRIERSIEIDAPVGEVFAMASDWERWPTWIAGVSEFEPVTVAERGNRARYAYRTRFFGLPTPLETETVDFRQDRGWLGFSKYGPQHRTRWIFDDLGGTTRLTFVLKYKMPFGKLGARLNQRFIESRCETLIEQSLANLRAMFGARPRLLARQRQHRWLRRRKAA